MDINKLIHCATLAPSGHNTQPWKFSVTDNIICIYPDFTRRLPVVDPDDHALYISLGCALENLVVSAEHHGSKAEVDYFSDNEREECLRITLTPNESGDTETLFRSISVRQSNRSTYNGKAANASYTTRLCKEAPSFAETSGGRDHELK